MSLETAKGSVGVTLFVSMSVADKAATRHEEFNDTPPSSHLHSISSIFSTTNSGSYKSTSRACSGF